MRTRLVSHAALFLVFIILLLPAGVVGAETVCISRAVGVPGQPNVPPHWWDAAGEPGSGTPTQPPYHTCVTDPRWVEATAIAYDSGAGEDVLFRALYDTDNVYLSWLIKNHPGDPISANAVYFGFQDSGAADGGSAEAAGDRIVRMQLNDAGAIEASGASLTFATFRLDGTGHGMAGDATPSWLTGTAKAWVNTPACLPTCNCLQNPANFWAVQLRLPRVHIAAGPTFKFWFEADTVPGMGVVVPFSWPRVGGQIVPDPMGGAFPLAGTWNSFQFTGCTPSGVSIDWQNVGAHAPGGTALSTLINYKKVPDDAPTHPQNVLAARPANHTGATIPAGRLGARFRIANWESMPHWEDGVPIDQLWAIVQCGTDGSPTVVNCGENGRNKADILNNTTATDANEIIMVDPSMVSTPWALTNAQLAPFRDGTKRADNCMLVEMYTVPGAPPLDLFFDRRSVRTNMIFSHASDFVHRAAATNMGLASMAGGRDMYILVEALNMPRSVPPDAPVPKIPVHGQNPNVIGSLNAPMASQTQETVSVTDDRMIEKLTTEGRIATEDLDKALPTYRVHVYYDTGIRRQIAGGERVIARAQGVFGYYLAYTPPVVGWRHLLEAEGFTLEEIEPNFYRIRKVPANTVIPLKVSVRSLHQGESDFPPLGATAGGGGHWRYFLDLGPNFPHGSFANGVDGKWSLNAGFERLINSAWSVEGIVGYHRFDAPFVSNPHIWQFSVNGKRWFGTGSQWHPFLNAGAGAYRFDPGNTTKVGWNAGGGVLYDVTSTWGVEGVYNYHSVHASGGTVDFSTVQVGARIRF